MNYDSPAIVDSRSIQSEIPGSRTVRVYVDPGLGEYAAPAFAALTEIVRMAGWPTERCSAPSDAHICYARDQNLLNFAGVGGWRQLAAATPSEARGAVLPSTALIGADCFDQVIATQFFLCGLYERDPECLENNGVPGLGALKWGIDRGPLINRIALELRDKLVSTGSLGIPRPLWPQGKTWALALSHDCDLVFFYKFKTFLTDSWRALRQRRLSQSALNALKAAYSAVARLVRTDKYLESWRRWIDFERALAIRSAFYIGTWNRADPQSHMADTVCDLGYDHRDPRLTDLTRELHNGGWEIGLHSGTQAWMHEGRYELEFERFTSTFGVTPQGQRGHYWCLDPRAPHATFGRIKDAGFGYDSSLGMNRLHGYRRQVAYPFMPYDPSSGSWSGIWELPPVIMDYALHLSGANAFERLGAFRQRVKEVREASGLLLLDWHEYTLADGIMDGLARQVCDEIAEIANDTSCWIATPGQIHQWCAVDRWKN